MFESWNVRSAYKVLKGKPAGKRDLGDIRGLGVCGILRKCVWYEDSSGSGQEPVPICSEHVMNLQLLREVGNSLGKFSRRLCCSELVNGRQ
jgi:hypothetical protein